ncbi:hypothetical protein pb186bvf_015425 [Paramecium bursaria]
MRGKNFLKDQTTPYGLILLQTRTIKCSTQPQELVHKLFVHTQSFNISCNSFYLIFFLLIYILI